MMLRNDRTSRRRHGAPRRRTLLGFTVMELLLAATLTAVFAGLVGQSIVATTRTAVADSARAVAQSRARAAIAEIERALTSARPLGTCLSPSSDDVALTNCLRVGEKGFVLAEANADRVVLYAYTTSNAGSTKVDGTSGGGEILTAPDKVVIEVTTENLLLINRYSPATGATYTNPSWSDGDAPALQIGAGTVSNRAVFTYYTRDGQLTSDPAEVAMVELDITVEFSSGRRARTFTLSTTVMLSGSLYGRGGS
jgi:type II secretory pathway pseudopilin PulG